ncbi:hypothetical protein BDQ17DRAFT_1356069 [Cyathus striatus]|nr:hypothetical protein BDQ17DRAFT_1356069 [Cyathus striatus]
MASQGDVGATVMQFIPNAEETRDDLKKNLLNLEGMLISMRRRSTVARFWSYSKDPDVIVEMKQNMENALKVFHMPPRRRRSWRISRNMFNVLTTISNMALNTLPYAEGAAWNPTRVCLPETRIPIQETIWQAEVFCIADVAGSGKSALSHSVAKYCYEKTSLDRPSSSTRDSGSEYPRKFITTLARDLSLLSKDIAEHMSISHQFHKIILEPFSRYPIGRPFAVIIDALDEGYDNELLTLLCDEIPKLPPCFRIFLTTRPEEDIATLLFRAPHVRQQALDIHNEQNLSDIAIYARSRLQEVAIRKRMGLHWPSRHVVDEFTRMAEGLFIWVSTICDYLLHSTAPDKKLNALIKDRNFSDMGAEEKMTKLYSTILNSCNWNDKDFVEGYRLVMGAIIALKTPLSSNALQSLHRNSDLRVSEVTYPLAPLLTGSTQEEQPIRLPHLSLRDFITHHSLSDPDYRKFCINEKEHSRRLARLCLAVLEQDLLPGSLGTGYLVGAYFENRSLPELSKKEVSEVMHYTCRFWIDHVIDIKGPFEPELVDELESVLLTRIVSWAELCKLRDWVHAELPMETRLHNAIYRQEVAQKLVKLSYRLSFHGRSKEALECAEEASELSKNIVSRDPSPEAESVLGAALNAYACRLQDMGDREGALLAAQAAVALREKARQAKNDSVDADLANYLTTLARALSNSGKPEDSLATIDRAVKLQRELIASDPKVIKPLLATSLNTLSARLSEVGQKQSALKAAEETVQLRRELVAENPQRHTADLAISLNTFSARLSRMGKTKEALEVAQESVKLHRGSAADRPATYQIHLAGSLNTLSARLSTLNMHEEALKAAEEAVEIRKQFAKENPRAFKPNYAMSLNTLSARLSAVGRCEEALETGKTGVEMLRELAVDRPKVHDGTLAFSLYSLARRYADLNRTEDAVRTAQESIYVLRPLAAEHPSAFNIRVAEALELVARFYSTLGRLEEEHAARKESISFRRGAKQIVREESSKAEKERNVVGETQ